MAGMIRAFAVAVLALVPALALPHGGVVEEDDLCVINIGYLKAHFKIYVPQETQHEEYCEDIPVRGESVFVMEYQHDGLSTAAMDFRIIRNTTGKGTFARLEDVEAIDNIESITVRYQPPVVTPDVFTLLQAFPEDGEYIGIVSARQADTGKLYTAVFPFEVGYTGIGYWPWILGGLLVLQLNYWYMSKRRARSVNNVIAVLAFCILPMQMVRAGEVETWASDAGYFRVSYHSELQPLAINKIHNWVLRVTDGDGEAISDAVISFDGGMPEHNHGLPTEPEVTAVGGDGTYQVAGVRFHMPGYWEIRILVETPEQRDYVTIPLEI
jgi:hypothetical protein